jgi:methylase of polypeptide subunit release factors
VLGVGGASLTLAGLQLPTSAARVLDVGAGCGIQALRARRYAATSSRPTCRSVRSPSRA